MVRVSVKLLKEAGSGLNKTLSEILVCPLSKQPLRFDPYAMPKMPPDCSFFFLYVLNCLIFVCLQLSRLCEETNSLISDAIGVSFPVSSKCSNFVTS